MNPSPTKCMYEGCSAPPEHECIWADGRAHAWFCGKHYDPWKLEADLGEDGEGGWLELVKERKVDGEVGAKYGESPKKASATRVAQQRWANDAHGRSIALMKFLSKVTTRLGVARDVYVVGGAIRNFVIDRPIKDIDVVIDAVALGGNKDSGWLAQKLAQAIPTATSLVTNQYGVAILTVKGPWTLDGNEMQGEVIEIANARKESYGGSEGKGYKPSEVVPATIEEDVYRREFTFNTLLWRLLDLANGPDKAEIIDLTGCGLRDLQEMNLKCPQDPDVVFADDPTRLMRAIKFVAKYGFKIPPDLAASIKRNALKMKQAPWEAVGTLLVENVLNEPTAPEALKLMKKLGLLDVVAEMVQEQKPFASYLAGQLGDRKVSLLLDLMDLGLNVRSPISFLDRDQQQRLREVTTPMPEGQAEAFLETLKKVPLDNMALINSFGIPKQERGILSQKARELMLADPELAFRPAALQKAMEDILGRTYRTASPSRVASRFMEAQGTSYMSVKNLHQIKEQADSLLGEIDENTPLDDWAESLLTEAAVQLRNVHDYMSHSKTAAQTGDGKSVGLFIPLPEELAAQYPTKEKDTSPPHATFLYIGEVPKAKEKDLLEVLSAAFSKQGPVHASLGELDRFMNVDAKVVFSRLRFSRDLSKFRDQVREDLESAGFEVADSFLRWNPHVTIEYMDHADEWEGTPPTGSWSFNGMDLWGLPKKHEIEFGGLPKVDDTMNPGPEIGSRRRARIMAKRANAALLRHRWG